jgi:PAT family beta-lactamase induction signal transducer AmpG
MSVARDPGATSTPGAASAVVTAELAERGRLRRIAAAFREPAAGTLFFFGFGCGLPFFLVGQTMSIWLRDTGVALSTITFASIVSFFYVFKFLWSPLIDQFRPPAFRRLGQRRGWLLVAQLLLITSLVGAAAVGPQSFAAFLALLGVVGFAGATHDALVDAYRIEIAPAAAQGALVATYSLGYRMGLIAGGAGALYIAEYADWRTAYACMAGLVLVPMMAVLCSPEPAAHRIEGAAGPMRAVERFIEPFHEFLKHHGVKLAVVLLLFVGLYKLPDQVLGVVAGPFYRDAGFSKAEIATVSKLYGIWVGLAGVLVGGVMVSAFSLRPLLLMAALGIALSNLLYLIMAAHPGAEWAFVLTISGDNFALGFAGTVLVAYMSSLTSHGFSATQYALLSSLANLPGKLLALATGSIVEAWGYVAFFVLSAVSLVPTLVLLAWLWRRIGAAPGGGTAAGKA